MPQQKGGRKRHGGQKGGRAAYVKKAKTQPPPPSSLPVIMTPGLDIFSKPLTDSSIFGIEPKKIYPINDALNPIEFHIDSREKWIDLQRSYLHFNAGLLKHKNAWADDAVGTVQNFGFSIFSQVEISINGRQVSIPSPKSFAYVQWFRAFFNLSDDDKKTWGALQGYLPIDNLKDTVAGDDEAFTPRKLFTSSDIDGAGTDGYSGDRPYYLPLKQIPAFGTMKFIPPQVTLNIKFYPHNNNWPLMSANDLDVSAHVTNSHKPYLKLFHPMINPRYALQLEKALTAPNGRKARYTLDNVVMRDYTIPDNLSSHHITDVVPPGPMPKRIVLMLQPQDHFEKPNTAAGRVLNPFTFAQNNLWKIETDGDGGWDEINLVEEPTEGYRRFMKMFENTGEGVRLTGPEYFAKYNMYFFDFTPATSPADPLLYKLPHGSQRFTLHFTPKSANNTKALFMLFYTSELQLNMLGSVDFEDRQ